MPEQKINMADWLRLCDTLSRQSWDSWKQTLEELRACTDQVGPTPQVDELLDRLWRLLGSAEFGQRDDDTACSDFMARARKSIEQGFTVLKDRIPPTAKPLANLLAFWTRLLEPSDRDSAAAAIGWTLPHLPRLGPFQNQQTQVEQAADALETFRIAYFDYLCMLEKIALEILERWMSAVAQRGHTDGAADVDDLYNLWIEIGESVYEDALETEAYAGAHSALINAALDVLRSTQMMVDRLTGFFNLPNRRDLVSTQRRLHELRRRHFQLSDELDTSNPENLRREVAALRDEVRALRLERQREDPPPASRAVPQRSRRS